MFCAAAFGRMQDEWSASVCGFVLIQCKAPSVHEKQVEKTKWDLTKQEGMDLFCKQQRLTLHSNMILHSETFLRQLQCLL